MAHHRSLLVAIRVVLASMATLGSAIALLEYLSAPIDAFLGRLIGADNPSIGLLRATAYGALLIFAVVVVLLGARLSAITRSHATGRANLPEQVRLRYLTRIQKEIEQRLRASIHHQVIALQHHERIDAVNPFNFLAERGAEPERTFSVFSECFEHFDRRVLLLGDPGSGKSTTLLLFAERLVADALDDPNRPVPLLANLAQMQAGETPKGLVARFIDRLRAVDDRKEDRGLQHRLAQLVAKEVHVEGLDAEIVDDWIEEGRVVLLLDGLDEVDDGQRALLADDLNCTLLDRHSQTPTVIASRVVEYRVVETEGKHLRLDGAVTLQPLSDAQIADYVEKAGASGLRRALPDDSALKELARAPLTLSMMTLAYQGLEPAEIRADLAGLDRRHALFDRFVDRMMQREAWRRAGRPWDPRSKHRLKTPYTRDRIDRYLGWLATVLSRRSRVRFDGRLASLLAVAPVDGHREWSDPFLQGQVATILVLSVLFGAVFGSLSDSANLFITILVCVISATLTGLSLYVFHQGKPDLMPVSVLVLVVATFLVMPFAILGVYSAWTIAISTSLGIPVSLTAVAPIAIIYVIWLSVMEDRRRFYVSIVCIPAISGGLYYFGGSGLFRSVSAGAAPGIPFGAATALLVMLVISIQQIPIRSSNSKQIFLFSRRPSEILGFPIPIMTIVIFGLSGLLLETMAATFSASKLLNDPMFFGAILCPGIPFFVALRWYMPLGLTLLAILIAYPSGSSALVIASAPFGVAVFVFYPLLAIATSPDRASLALKQFNTFWRRILSDPLVGLASRLQGQSPWRSRRFLHYATDILILRRDSSELGFSHLLLRDHFAVGALVPALTSTSAEARLGAIKDLARQGEAALNTLDVLYRDRDPRIKAAAVDSMTRIPSDLIADRIEGILRTESSKEIRESAIAGIERVAESKAAALLDLVFCQEESSEVRKAATARLWRVTKKWDAQIEPVVKRVLEDPDTEVRLQAIYTGIDGSSSDWSVAGPLLYDPAPEVVRAVLLWYTLHNRVRNLLVAFDYKNEADANRIAPILLGLLDGLEDDDQFFSFRKVQEARTAESRAKLMAKTLGNAAEMLGVLGYESAEPRLCQLCGHPRELTREAVVRALGDMPQGVDSASALVARLSDTSPKVRFAALEALRKVASEVGWNSLPDAVRERASLGIECARRDRRPRHRAAGVRALDLLPADLGEALLRSACRDRATAVREAALETMARIDADHFVAEIVPLLAATGTRDAAIKALRKARLAPVVKALQGLLGGPPSRKQVGALLALGEMRARESVPAIGSLLERSNERSWWRLRRRRGGRAEQLRRLCVQTLVRIGDPATVSDIDQSLRDGDLDSTLSKRLDAMRRARI